MMKNLQAFLFLKSSLGEAILQRAIFPIDVSALSSYIENN